MKFSYQFLLDSESGRDDLKLRLRVRWSGRVVSFGVGYRVDASKWSRETQRCKNSTTHGDRKISASVINRKIQELESVVVDLFSGYQTRDVVPSVDQFRSDFNKAIGKAPAVVPISIFAAFDEFVNTSGQLNSWSHSMHQKFGTFRAHLFAFAPGLSFDLLTDSVLTDFVNYLNRCGLRNISIDKNLKMLRWFLRWAFQRGYYSGRLHETFRPRLKGADGNKEVIHLSWDELLRFLDFDFYGNVGTPEEPEFLNKEKAQALDRVRDVFCFCCFTGLRYSDAAKLTRDDIRDGSLHVVTQKTADALKIELNEFSESILKKWEPVSFPSRRVLPVISNQKMNEQLKIAARVAGLKSPQRVVYFKGSSRFEEVLPLHDVISTHAGRRTFIVNALYLGIPSEVIMRWTGHKNFASMKPYVKIVDDLKAREMSKFRRDALSPGDDSGD
jgi:integrase